MPNESNNNSQKKTNEDKENSTWVKKTASNDAGVGHQVGGLSGTTPGGMRPDRTPPGAMPPKDRSRV